jgi:chromosome segregation ATPase
MTSESERTRQINAENTRLTAEVAELTARLRELEEQRLALTDKAARAEGGLAACEQHIQTLATALDVERLRGQLQQARERVAALEEQARDQLVRLSTVAAAHPRESA